MTNPHQMRERSKVPLTPMSPRATPIPHFEHMAPERQATIVLDLLSSAHFHTLQTVASHILPRLKKDFLSSLPTEISIIILKYLNLNSLAKCARTSKAWNRLLSSSHVDFAIWKSLIMLEKWKPDPMSNIPFPYEKSVDLKRQNPNSLPKGVTYKQLFQHHYMIRRNWFMNKYRHLSFPGHGFNVVTCLQMDDEKIVSGSDDLSIQIFDITNGTLKARLLGHEGNLILKSYNC